MANKELEQIIEKIKRTFNVYQDQEVAKLLGISRASLANHKTRNTVPYKEILSLCSKNKQPLDSILGTKSPKGESTTNKGKENSEMYYRDKCELYKEEIIHLLKENSALKTELISVSKVSSKKGGSGGKKAS